jgi:hypothetical protein
MCWQTQSEAQPQMYRKQGERPMKTEVRFVISNPIAFTSEENYVHLGIKTCIVGGKLVALETVAEHDVAAGHDGIISKAWSAIASLLTLIEFGHGLPVNIGEVHTHAIEPASEVSMGLGFVKVGATLPREVPMPPAQLVATLSEKTRLQLNWYLLGRNSPSVIEQIKDYYKVLEQQKQMTAKSAPRYPPPEEARLLRNAVSHPEPESAKSYLRKNIGSSRIDPKNEAHIRFLESKVSLLQSEAQRVLDGKVPKWW